MGNLANVEPANGAEGARGVSETSDRLSESLHTNLSSSGRVWLMLDPSPLGMQEADKPALAKLIAHSALCRIEPRQAGVPTNMAPALLPLNVLASADSAILRSSVELALNELASPLLAQGGGRVIAAWLECDEDLEHTDTSLHHHIARSMFARRSDGRTEWLRWYDPAVLWVLWPRLRADQQALLLGPVRRHWLLTPSGTLLCLSAPTAPESRLKMTSAATATQIEFTATQWAAIDAVGALNLALVEIHASELDDVALARYCDIGMSALARAQQAGFADRRDLAAYASKALTCHAEFDQHAIVAQRLRAAQRGDFFSAIVDDITESQWRQIAGELNARSNVASMPIRDHLQ